jgi:hypothetical protein
MLSSALFYIPGVFYNKTENNYKNNKRKKIVMPASQLQGWARKMLTHPAHHIFTHQVEFIIFLK